MLKQIRANAGSDILEEVTEGTVEEGDTANIDYEGKLDGEAFEGGTAKDTDLEIGSGTFIPGFEDGLVGVKIGDTVDLPLTFPENYTEELAGKDVVFTIGAPNGRLEEARHICIIFSRLRYSSRYSAFPFRQFVVTSRQRVCDFT